MNEIYNLQAETREMVMEEAEAKEQEQWIEKYRAAVEAVSKKPRYSPGLGAFVDVIRSRLEVAFRSARARLRKSIPPLEPSENVVASNTIRPPIGDGQTKAGVAAEPSGSCELEKAS
jgi:hypothetical protein